MAPRTQTSQTEKPIQVFVRVRPLNQIEKNSKSFSVVGVNNGKEVSVKERPMEKTNRNFTFDKVFGPESKQIDVYKKVVYPLIDEVLTGYNCTVFAYGQTGTGKTFTMEGCKSGNANICWEDDPLSGIIPRSLSHLFDELRIKQLEHTVRVSFLELYNEELFDLLSSPEDTTKLRLFEDSNKKGSVIIQSLEEVPVHNKAEIYKLMEKGSQKRQTAATLMNAHSSRSHTIFSITVHIKETSEKGEELFKIGKLNLVDLAGSENIGRSGAVDKRAREAGNINQSLLTLGRVITSLVEKAPHIPYRESKLTRLLQDSLGGRTKTSIIATVSPALCNLEETMSTLEYASRAKSITNRPEVNQKLTKKAFLKEYEEEIDRLKKDLMAARDRNGIFVDPENYTKMNLQLEEQEKEISDFLTKIKALTAEMEKRQKIITDLETLADKAKEEIERRKETCRETRKALKEVTIDRDENKYLKEKHMETEEKLKKQAEQLLTVADVATTDTFKLHEKIERKGHVEKSNLSTCEQFCVSSRSLLSELETKMIQDNDNEAKLFNLLKGAISNNKKLEEDCLEEIRSQLQTVCHVLSVRMENFTSSCEQSRKAKHDELSQGLNELKLKLDSNNDTLDSTILEGIIPQLNDVFDHLNDLDTFLVDFNTKSLKVNEDVNRLRTETFKLKDFTKQQIENYLTSTKNIETNEDKLDELDAAFLEFTDARNKDVDEFAMSVKAGAQAEAESAQAAAESAQAAAKAAQAAAQAAQAAAESAQAAHAAAQATAQAVSKFIVSQAASKKQLENLTSLRISTVKESHSLVKNLANTMKENLRECEPNFTEVISLVAKVDHNLSLQQNETVEKLRSWKESEVEKVETVKVDVENLSSVSNESKKIFDIWSSDFDKTLCESDVKESEFERKETQTILTDVTEEISNSKSALDTFSESSATAIIDMENNIDDRLISSEKSRTDMTEILQAQNSLIEKFLQEDIKTDVPTGSTPQKREFDYPHDLTATSPHEIILQRYRETVQHDLSLNDSLETTATEEMAKKSSSESLSASSTSLNQKENDSNSVSPVSFKHIPRSVSKKRILGQANQL